MGELTSIIEAIKPSICVLKSGQNKSGTGFFLNEKGLFITNKHTVKLGTYLKIMLNDGTEKNATVVSADNDIDFAFAIADIEHTVPVKLADSTGVQEGQQVVAIGHPYGYDFTISKGIVSCKDREVKGIHYIQTDVPINPCATWRAQPQTASRATWQPVIVRWSGSTSMRRSGWPK